MTLIGNTEGRLRAYRQVDDYAYRGVEFESMGYLTFIVETYERRNAKTDEAIGERSENFEDESIQNRSSAYLYPHPKSGTHFRVRRSKNHNSLPNIVGPWFPRRDGEGTSRCYYYAAMLALLKPWRDLRQLKSEDQTWGCAFDIFMRKANQKDRDVIAGSQYFYESRKVAANRSDEDERSIDMDEGNNTDNETYHDDDIVDLEDLSTSIVVSKIFILLKRY
jgi:hypothetical protein